MNGPDQLLCPGLPRRRQNQVSGRRVQGRRSRSHATARRAALHAVAAIRTIEREEDVPPGAAHDQSGHCCLRVGRRGRAGRASQGRAGRGERRTRRRRRRLDLNTARFGSAASGAVCPVPVDACVGGPIFGLTGAVFGFAVTCPFAGGGWREAGIGAGGVVGCRAALPGCAGGRGGGSGDRGRGEVRGVAAERAWVDPPVSRGRPGRAG